MKLSSILNFQLTYSSLQSQKMPIKLAYKFSKLNSFVQNELKFYQENLTTILQEYAQKDENGDFIRNDDQTGICLIPEKIEECYKKIEELQNLEIEEPPVTFTFDEIENFELTIEEFQGIENFII